MAKFIVWVNLIIDLVILIFIEVFLDTTKMTDYILLFAILLSGAATVALTKLK